VIFALVLALFFTAMIALVADLGAMFTAYNRFDDAALLAAQAGASAVSEGDLYAGSLRLNVEAARTACEQSLSQAHVAGSCHQTSASAVIADVDSPVSLPVSLFGREARIHVRHAASPAFGQDQGTVSAQ
jgi:hypothetical protein